MGEEAYQIKDYFHDEAVAFTGSFLKFLLSFFI